MSRSSSESPAQGPRKRRPLHAHPIIRAVLAVIVGGLALVVFAVAALLFLFRTGNPALTTRIVAEVNRAVTTDSTRFTSDGLRGTPLHGVLVENPKLLVLTQDGEVAWAQARSMRVDFDLIAYLFGQRQDLRIELDQPRIDLVHDRRGELVMPRFVTAKKRLELQAGKLELSGELDMEKATLRARPLEIKLGATQITAEVDWDLEKARVRDGTLDLHPLEVREFFQALEIASEDGTARGEVTFSGTPTDGHARVCLAGTFAGETVDTLVLEARSRPGAVDFSRLSLRVRSTNVTGGGTLTPAVR